jgi:hypothetical protein
MHSESLAEARSLRPGDRTYCRRAGVSSGAPAPLRTGHDGCLCNAMWESSRGCYAGGGGPMPASLGEHGRALTTRGGSRRVGLSGFRALNPRLPRTRPKPEFGTSQPHEVIGSPTWRCGVPSAVASLTAGRSLNAATTHDAAAAISPTRGKAGGVRRKLLFLVGLYLLVAVGTWTAEALGLGGPVSAAPVTNHAGASGPALPYFVGLHPRAGITSATPQKRSASERPIREAQRSPI